MNLHTRDYDGELLKLFGLEEIAEALPPLCRATEICGHVTEEAAERCGLLPGTPVVGGMFDINACALAAGVTDPNRLCMIAGTWSINEYVRREPVTDGSVLMNSLFCLPEYYLIEESSPTSAGNNEWFVRELLPELGTACKAGGESIRICTGVSAVSDGVECPSEREGKLCRHVAEPQPEAPGTKRV